MDYEKAYKEALERARKCLDEKRHTCFVRPDVIFPELKESEDERIRKEPINKINALWEDDKAFWPYTLEEKNKYIAWLEKQAPKPKWNEDDDYYRDNLITWLNCGVVRVDLRKDFITWLNSIKKKKKKLQ